MSPKWVPIGIIYSISEIVIEYKMHIISILIFHVSVVFPSSHIEDSIKFGLPTKNKIARISLKFR